MTDMTEALFELLRPLGGDVWQGGAMTDTDTQPLLSWSVTEADWGEPALCTVTAWFHGETADQRRRRYMDQAETLIPPQGVLCPMAGGGRLLVTRRRGDFLHTCGDSRHPGLTGAALCLTVTCWQGMRPASEEGGIPC